MEDIEDTDYVASEHDYLVKAVSKLDKTQHITEPTRNEPTIDSSEFHLIKRSNELDLSNVVEALEGTANHVKISKKLKKIQNKSQVLKKPLEKPQAERIKRATGYEENKKKIGRWDPVVARARTVDYVSFPVKHVSTKLQPTEEFLSKLKLKSSLEKELDEVDPPAKVTEDDEEEQTYPMSYEEMVEQRQHLAKLRAQESYKAAKAKRQSKIKSKKYHRLVICDIDELPKGQGLETAMHPKRIRTWQPSNPAPLPTSSPSPSLVPPSIAPASPSVAPPSPASNSVPSPATSVECSGSFTSSLPASPMQLSSPSPSPSRRRVRHLQNEDKSDLINYGSDESDDNNDEEGDIVAPFIPRVFRGMIETPFDNDDAAGDPVPVTDTAPTNGLEPADVALTMTEQPWGLYNFDWREFPNPPIPPKSRREIFSSTNVGPATPHADPYDIFSEIWDRKIMEHIAVETNKYAQQVASKMSDNHSLYPTSRISRWLDTTADELYVYFGLILAMGIVVKSRLEEYWASSRDVFYTPGFSAYMSIDRFLLLNKCLHFSNNDDMYALNLDYSEARLFKIRPILLHLNEKFQAMYTPAQNVALDESLLMWKGWLEFCQIIPNKAANRGIKTYEICESQTGYLWRFEVHAHKKSAPQQIDNPLDASTPAIVLRLIKGLEHKGYTLWMDNYYQSPCLARRLKSIGFDCVGTLRTDRKFVPQTLNSLTKQNMRPGQIAGLSSGDVDVMVWRDTNRVAMISTYHGNAQQTVRGSTKPILIHDYNIMMGGVDKKDQLLAMYPVERKRTKVWYKKLFRRLLNVSVLNSYVIHSHASSLTHRNFRISLVKSLLSKHSTPRPIPLAITKKKADVSHRLAEFPMGNHQRMRRACTACKKQVRTFCVGCDKTVCMEPCFLTIHL